MGNRQSGRDDPGRVKAGFHGLHPEEAAHAEARPGEQDERQGHLGDDQGPAETWLGGPEPAPVAPSFIDAVRSGRVALRAGTIPKRTPVRTDSPRTNRSTLASISTWRLGGSVPSGIVALRGASPA